MAKEYTVTAGGDGRIFVLLHPGCKISKEEILAILQEAGCDPLQVTFFGPDEAADCDTSGGAAVIIPIDAEACELPELAEAARTCGNGGGRVVVLFGSGYVHEGLHPIAEKYGTQCGWSPGPLKDRISGTTDAPRTASGAPAERGKARQVDC